MQESSGAEKRASSRPPSAAPKPAGAAEKGSKSEPVNSAKFGKYNKKRESSNSKWIPNAANRKPAPQKSKSYNDKRPKSRGSETTTNVPTKEEEAALLQAEYGSVFRPGSKKQNLNHLLNFTFAPRDPSGHGDGRQRKRYSSYKHYDKGQFLQANCQFVVRAGHDYSVCIADPDTLVDWSLIEQVRISTTEPQACPICLHPPLAGRITRCGHVYCWSCLLHYLSLSDSVWRKCPICDESIEKEDLKSVTISLSNSYKPGDRIALQLMCRQRGSAVALPKAQWQAAMGNGGRLDRPFCVNDNLGSTYAKLLLADPLDVIEHVINRERDELLQLLAEEGDQPEACFSEQALQLLKIREDTLLQSQTVASSGSSGSSVMLSCSPPQSGQMDLAAFAERSEGYGHGVVALKSHDHDPGSDKLYYFYQACDGQNIYLDPVNVKCLMKEYGALDACPDGIEATIVALENFCMSEEYRHRFRYLNHVPLTAEVVIAELDLEPPVVGEATLAQFREEILLKASKRERRARREKREEIRIQRREEERMLKMEPMRHELDSDLHFPSIAEFNAASPPSPPLEHVQNSPPSAVDVVATESQTASSSGGVTFAQMVSKIGGGDSGWRKCALPQGGAAQPAAGGTDSEGEELCAAPQYQLSFSEALDEAFNRLAMQADDAEGGQQQVKKKGKKSKGKKLLFSTALPLRK